MSSAPSPHALLHRCRIAAAVLFGVSSLVLFGIGLGLSDLLPLPKAALAESEAADPLGLPSSVLSKERALRLRAAVDSTALSLGSVYYEAAAASSKDRAPASVFQDSVLKRQTLARALGALTFGLEGEVYFTAWQGTQALYSPLAPDAAGMDFADARDQRGSAFVPRMEEAAAKGGGFIQVTLPRQMAVVPGTVKEARLIRETDSLISGLITGNSPENTDAAGTDADSAGPEFLTIDPHNCPTGTAAARASCDLAPHPAPLDASPVEQVVYVRAIPHSNWHIAAFLPVVSAADPSILARDSEEDFRNGLFFSGFSLAGLAGLMLTPGGKR